MKEKIRTKGIKKRLLSVVLALAMVFSLLPMNSMVAHAATPIEGSSISWELVDGTLTISGSGEMPEFAQAKRPWYSDRNNISRVVIAQGVKSVAKYAFYNCSNLTEVTIPEGVTTIGNNAFYNCSGLTEVTIPASVTTIGEQAFGCCQELSTVRLSTGLITIGERTFYNCSKLTKITIPEGVTTIGNDAFVLCSSLTEVTIPTSVTSIGTSAFANCSSLAAITIPAGVTTIGEQTFINCSRLAAITIPAGVTTIGVRTFYNCSGLTEVTIPTSVTSIGTSAFGNCSSLAAITIPAGVTTIGESTFYNCSGLTEVTISTSVTSIEQYAFYNCSGLTEVTIPTSVTSIGQYAFDGCSKLATVIVNATVPPTIGSNAFRSTSSTLKIYVPEGKEDNYKSAWSAYADKIAMPHEHSWKYSATDNELEAYCENEGCDNYAESYENAQTNNKLVKLTLTASSANYSGGAYTGASLGTTTSWTTAGLSEPVIKYVGRGGTTYSESTTAPTAVGTYTAKITAGDKTATKDFEITKVDILSATFTEPTAPAYGGTPASSVAVTGDNYLGAISWSPVDTTFGYSTVYTATITLTAADNYKFKSDVTIPTNWTKSDTSTDTSLVLTRTYTATEDAPHTCGSGVKQDGQAATCTADGFKDYYKCGGCDKLYKEVACTNEITNLATWKNTDGQGKIAALGHAWGYNASGATLTATCTRNSAHTATLTLNASNANYSGKAATITIEGKDAWEVAELKVPEVKYEDADGKSLTAAPTTVGTYFATITKDTATAKVQFTIEQAHEANTEKYVTDEENHWNPCIVDGCDDTTHVYNKVKHSYDAETHKCVCGEFDPTFHTHTYEEKWTTDATNHWYAATCEHKDMKKDEAAHTYGDTKEARYTCSVCSYVDEAKKAAATVSDNKVDFEKYKTDSKDAVEKLLDKDATDEMKKIADTAVTDIDKLAYNEKISLSENKVEVDKICDKAKADIDALKIVPGPNEDGSVYVDTTGATAKLVESYVVKDATKKEYTVNIYGITISENVVKYGLMDSKTNNMDSFDAKDATSLADVKTAIRDAFRTADATKLAKLVDEKYATVATVYTAIQSSNVKVDVATLFKAQNITISENNVMYKIAGKDAIETKAMKKLAAVKKNGILTPKKTGMVSVEAYIKVKEGKKTVEKTVARISIPVVKPEFVKNATAVYTGQTIDAEDLLVEANISDKTTYKTGTIVRNLEKAGYKVTWEGPKSSKSGTIDPNTGIITVGEKAGTFAFKMVVTNPETNKSVKYAGKVKVVLPKMSAAKTTLKTTAKNPTKQLSVKSIVNADDQKVTWSVDKPEVANVDNNGLVKAVSAGDAVVTATVTAKDGGVYKVTCAVIVK